MQALEIFSAGHSLVIEAGAGTGKTTTLKLLALSTRKRGQYLAFNKAIVTESAAKMPSTVQCNTAHSLAFRAMGHRYKHRLNANRQQGSEMAVILGVKALGLEERHLSAPYLAGLTLQGIEQFCRSADHEPERRHVPVVTGLSNEANTKVAEYLEPFLRRAWADLLNTNGKLRFQHDHYLKAYQLSEPRIDADYILYDEAQDANPVASAIVQAQQHAQLVAVGDSCQQINSFTGAINALAGFQVDRRIYLTQSFRFGPAVAEIANVLLERLQAPLRLRGLDRISSKVGPVADPTAILARTNAGTVTRLIALQSKGHAVHLIGEGKGIRSFAYGARDLRRGQRTDHPDLACFKSWGDVRDYVEKDQHGAELSLNVRLIENFGVDPILNALESQVDEKAASVIVSTAHKSKGREWYSVQLAGDFVRRNQDGEIEILDPEELRLLYVACTRARNLLDIEAVSEIIYPSTEGGKQ